MNCPMCHRPFAPEELRLDLAMAFCRTCNTVRDLPENAAELVAAPGSAAPKRPAQRPRPQLPPGFSLEKSPDSATITWKTSLAGPLAGLLFGAVGVPAAALLQTTKQGASGTIDLEAMGLVLLILVPPLLYVVLATAINQNVLTVSGSWLRATHGPLPIPWRFAVAIPAQRLRQLFCDTVRTRHGSVERYRLCARVEDEHGKPRDHVLLPGLETAEQALFLEQYVESFLDITDAPVAGEVEKPAT